MKLPEINLKNTAIAGGLGYAGLYGLANMPSGLANGISAGAKAAGEITGSTSQAASNILSNVNLPVIPAFGTAAPFIAPMIAGGWAGKKLTDVIGIENKVLKNITSVAGVSAGALGAAALAGTSAGAAGFLTAGGFVLGGYYGLKYGAKTIGWTGRKLKGAFNGMKSA